MDLSTVSEMESARNDALFCWEEAANVGAMLAGDDLLTSATVKGTDKPLLKESIWMAWWILGKYTGSKGKAAPAISLTPMLVTLGASGIVGGGIGVRRYCPYSTNEKDYWVSSASLGTEQPTKVFSTSGEYDYLNLR